MADLTAAEAARLDKLRGKAKNLDVGTRIRNLELMTDPTSASQVKVVAGEDITGGELVYYSGWDATESCWTAALADANGGFPATAVALVDIASGDTGYVSPEGRIDATITGAAVNTSAGSVGDAAFLSDTAGGWSLTESTTFPQTIGYVAVDSATVGVIAVKIGGEIPDHTHAGSNGMGGALATTAVTNLDIGASGSAGTLDIFPATAANGKLAFVATNNTGNDTVTVSGPAAATAGDIELKWPNVAGTLLHSGTQDQAINADLQLGADAVEGTLTLYPATTNSGTFVVKAQDCAGDDIVTLQTPSTTAGDINITLPAVTGTLLTSGTLDQSINGDLQLGADAVEGLLTLYPATTNSGTFVIQATNNTGDDVVSLVSPGTATAGNITITLPNTTGTLLTSGTNPAADITLQQDLTLGSSGTEGLLTCYPGTASKGTLVIQATDNAGDDVVTLTNHANTGAAVTATLPPMTGTLKVYETTQNVLQPFKITLETGAPTVVFADGAADGFTQETNEEVVLRWNNTANPTKFAALFHIPNDLDASSNIVVHIIGMPTGGTDTPTFTIEAYFSGVLGNAVNADANCGGTSTEMTGGAVWQEETLTIGSADVEGGPCALTIIFNPTDGELGTDDCLMASIWIEYTGKALTS